MICTRTAGLVGAMIPSRLCGMPFAHGATCAGAPVRTYSSLPPHHPRPPPRRPFAFLDQLAPETRPDDRHHDPATTPRRRGEGQWGLGYHEPLNPAEQIKKEDDGLNVRERIERIFAPGGFRSIGKQDLRSRMRWWGLYTQRKQGVPGERTGSAEPEELEDEFFMLRIRIDGGAMTTEQLRAIAWASERFGRDVADVTDRQNVQLHWIRIEDVPAIWERLEAVGLSTQEACGDTPRVILGCPLAGVTPTRCSTPRPRSGRWPSASSATRRSRTSRASTRPRSADAPPAARTTRSTTSRSSGHRRPDGEPGYDLWVGGGLSTNPMFAQRLGAFVAPDRVPEVWAAVTGLFREYGYRRSRNHARLKFLVKDWGAERVREVLEKEFLDGPLPTGRRRPPLPRPLGDHLGVIPQRDGRVSVGFAPRAGRIAGHQLRLVADLADRFGRVGPRHRAAEARDPRRRRRRDRLVVASSTTSTCAPVRACSGAAMACTGIEFCKLAIGETKGRAQWLSAELEDRLPDFDEDVRIHVNGCPNSCARFQVADIGLMSALRVRPDGTKSMRSSCTSAARWARAAPSGGR